MKFNINKEILVDTLQKVLGPTTTKQNFPVLNSVLLTCQDDTITFTATDLDTTITSSQKGGVVNSGKVLVPMKRLLSIVRELPPQEITVEATKSSLLISCGKIEFKVNTLDSEEFPQQPQENKSTSLIKILPQELEEMIKLTSFCVGYEDVSYVLGGVLFEIEKNKINLVATDGKRLAFCQKPLPINQPELKTKISFILPIKAVAELYKLLKEQETEVYLSVATNNIGFDFSDTHFVARPLEGEFPSYSQYIPSKGKEDLVVDRKNLLFALRRANLLSTQDHQGVVLNLKKNNLIISKNTPQLGEVKEELGVNYDGGGFSIGFNPVYLIDVLKNLEDKDICINFSGVDKPAVLRREGYVYLLLPIKI